MDERAILVIDEGTTSTRAMLFAPDGTLLGQQSAVITQHYPAPGLVEHDADEIWTATLACTQAMVKQAGGADRIACIGITNQRETIVFWNRRTGQALGPAIVWQDRRTANDCARLKAAGYEPLVQVKTGLLLDPYFSASKIGWCLREWPQLAAAGDDLAVGTIDAWLVHKLTGGAHVTDATNAARTALMDIGGQGSSGAGWDGELCELFGVGPKLLPEIVDCAGPIGVTTPELFGRSIPITGMAGDQQAATIGQACLAPGQVKATYGTGAFVLAQAGKARPVSGNRLLATIAWQIGGERNYALEGSIFVAGSLVKWLRDSLGLIASAEETEHLARSVADNGGVTVIPALSGLGAPHWRAEARGLVAGLSFASTRAHIARGALEAMAHQTCDLKTAFAADGVDWAALRIDGGMVANDWMAQDLADILDIPVERPDFVETTALGAAMLAAVGAGLYPDLEAATAMRRSATRFEPQMSASDRDKRLVQWRTALSKAL